jgi:nucleoside-diphosphate-sugar epimerase
MITAGIDGMMIPNPMLSMNTDSRTKVSAARDEVKKGGSDRRRRAGHCPAYVPCHASLALHPKSPAPRRTHHGPERTIAARHRARAAVAALCRARFRRVSCPLRQDLAHSVRPAAAHVAAAERGQLGHNYLLGGAQASYVGLAQTVATELGLKRRFSAVNPTMLSAYAGLEEWIAPLFGREPDVTRGAVDLLSKSFYCSSRKAEQELGYRPVPLEEMVRDCATWMRGAGLL